MSQGHTIFACDETDCPVITFVDWSNQPNSPSKGICPKCQSDSHPVKAIFNEER